MPRQNSATPTYLYHVSGQARVYLDGRYFYLGEHDSPESYARFYALLSIYIENGKKVPADATSDLADSPITVRCVTSQYREHAKQKYANNDTQRRKCNNICTLLEDEYADLPVSEFAPLKLSTIRDLIATTNQQGRRNTRGYINQQVRLTG